MADLPNELHEPIQSLCEKGNELLDEGEMDQALSCFAQAWEKLPEPRTDWDAATWILAAIADTHFFREDFTAMRDPLMTAMRCEGATENSFLRLRLGQCLYELGELDEAANWLTGAFLEEGQELFSQDDPKYLTFVKSQLQPPPGGWPEGW